MMSSPKKQETILQNRYKDGIVGLDHPLNPDTKYYHKDQEKLIKKIRSQHQKHIGRMHKLVEKGGTTFNILPNEFEKQKLT